MPMTLADGRTKLIALTTKPANPEAVTGAELTAGINLSNRILKSDYRLSATGSDTVPDVPLSSKSNAVVFGASNFEGSVTPIRFLTSAGLADVLNDVAWDLLREKGTRLWLVEIEGPEEDAAPANGDAYDLYEVITDDPQKPSDRSGYIKRVVPLGVQSHWTGVVSGAAGAPIVTAATPSAVAEDGMVTISGAAFTGATAVTFGGTAATAFTVLSDALIVATVPAGAAGSAAIVVTTPAGSAPSFAYTRGA